MELPSLLFILGIVPQQRVKPCDSRPVDMEVVMHSIVQMHSHTLDHTAVPSAAAE